MIRRGVFLALAALICFSSPSQAGDTQTEVVPELNAYVKLGERVRVYALADLTRAPRSWTANETGDVQELEFGPSLDFTMKPILRRRRRRMADWERERYLWARVGYNYVTSLGGPESSHENRGILQLTVRVPLPDKFWLVNRDRLDLRNKNGRSWRRYRYRLQLERETTLFGLEYVPYVNAEALYDTRYDAWTERRYQAGVEVIFDKSWRLEPNYLRTENDRSEPLHTNSFGLVLKYYR